MKEDMLLHRASAFVYDTYKDPKDSSEHKIAGLKSAFEDCIANFKYQTFPEAMDAKQMPDSARLPLEQDGRDVWNNYVDFFTNYIEVFYPDGGKKVENDADLNAYWASLEKASNVKDGNGELKGYDLPELSKQTLIEQLAHTAFWVTAIHEVAGSVVEMFESPRALLHTQ